jgi:hypothetical protein
MISVGHGTRNAERTMSRFAPRIWDRDAVLRWHRRHFHVRLPAGPVLLKGGQKKCQAERLADYEANVILLQEKAIVCQVIICVEENNPR